jgi:hypothetical protein
LDQGTVTLIVALTAALAILGKVIADLVRTKKNGPRACDPRIGCESVKELLAMARGGSDDLHDLKAAHDLKDEHGLPAWSCKADLLTSPLTKAVEALAEATRIQTDLIRRTLEAVSDLKHALELLAAKWEGEKHES